MNFARFNFSLWLLFSAAVMTRAQSDFQPVPPVITEVTPVSLEQRGAVQWADFGQDAYGSLKIQLPAGVPSGELKVRLGEKLDAAGAIDRQPGGSVNYREVSIPIQSGQTIYELQLPTRKFPAGNVSRPVQGIGEIEPFRYVEIEGLAQPLAKSNLCQLTVHTLFDDDASAFESSDATLNAVWNLCKHTMKATTAFGFYIDGDRERTPYEADAYINQLSHYACDLDPLVARATFSYLLAHPTWPTEWSFHMPMIAAEDYLARGDLQLARDHYDALKKKLMMNRAREDGLLRAYAIVDWPQSERDGYNNGKPAPDDNRQIGPVINTVANAFYYHALCEMAMLAHALNNTDDAQDFETAAAKVYASFNRVFFDETRGIYIDGEGSAHASLHANMFPLAFGLVPTNHVQSVADFVQSRGMACSVYGAQYLLEALFDAGRSDAAIQLMTAHTKRSWWHMIELGSTMTLEAWDAEFKKNLDWNHAWGAAPANIISRFVLGVRPIKPGYATMLIAPQPGNLKWVRGKVPTAAGPVSVNIVNAAKFRLVAELPPGAKARIIVPRRSSGTVSLDGKTISRCGKGRNIYFGWRRFRQARY